MRYIFHSCNYYSYFPFLIFRIDAVHGDIDRDMLIGIYERVKANEFKTGNDHVSQVIKVQSTIVGKKLVSSNRCYTFKIFFFLITTFKVSIKSTYFDLLEANRVE